MVAKWLRQEFHRASTQGLHSHVCISMRRDEDGWDPAALAVQPGLEIEAGHSRHTDIGD
jgi:hypothetical protein